MGWLSARAIIERYPHLSGEDVLTAWAALDMISCRSEPVFARGRLVGTSAFYDPRDVEELLAALAVNEMRGEVKL